jgi:predicted dehydrogenase
MADDLRIALVGYGLAGEAFHAPLIEAVDGFRLAFIVTSNAERAAAAHRRHPRAEIVVNADALWQRAGEIDAVVIASPNRTHVPLGLAGLDAGLHVVIDKPLAATSTGARQLIAAAERSARILTVFQNRRWDGDFLTLRELLSRDMLGSVVRFESRFEKWRPVPKKGWRESTTPEDAGGMLYDLGSHLIDQALVLFGPVRAVYAEVDRRRAGASMDDDVFVALTHTSGVRSHLWMSAVAAQPGPRMRVRGIRGAWTKYGFDPQEAALRTGRRPEDPGWGAEPESNWGRLERDGDNKAIPGKHGDYRQFYVGLVHAIRDGLAPPVDPHDALSVASIIEAAQRSAACGRVEHYESTW